MELKYKEVKVITVSDWDNLVKEVYGKPYNFQQQDDCKARGYEPFTVWEDLNYDLSYCEDFTNKKIPYEINGKIMGVSFQTWLNTTEEDIKSKFLNRDVKLGFDIFWHRNFYPHISILAQDLYKKGLIEAGDYLIKIDW